MNNNAQKPNKTYPPYQALSPISDTKDQQYLTAIQWALENRKEKDIKNIAITGPYGSGKSSILKTFKKQNTNDELKFLNISLATFKEDLTNEASGDNGKLLQLIELSILQQIFYHEEDKNIPNSRFKKIKNFDDKLNKKITLYIFIYLIALLGLLYPSLWENVVGYGFFEVTKQIVRYLSALIVIGLSYVFLRHITKTLTSLTVNKLKFQNAEIEIGKDITKSVLNHHLDEILYFFEATAYTVVIIEDLDRFEQTEIFTKLRELNLLINNSKKIKRDIAFIYAVRDDMFKDKDRTKFFDFIIPIIPIINSSNSSEQFSIILKKLKYKIDPNLIGDISLFIDDMRLLYNIVNEYLTYHHSLDKALDQNKILALIVYKNLHPEDFVKLNNEQGELHKILLQKNKYLAIVQDQLNESQNLIIKEIAAIQNLSIKTVDELKTLYLQKTITKLYNFRSFKVNDIERSFDEMIKDENFQYLIDDVASYEYFKTYRNTLYDIEVNEIPMPFSDIEKEIDPNQSFEEKQKLINDHHQDKVRELQTKVRKHEEERVNLRKLKLSEIITKGDIKIELDNPSQNQLVNILLRNSYIDEDYQEFISVFYPNSIEPSDRTFLLNIKSQIAMPIDFKLQKIDKLIAKIHETDFDKQYILNINLFDHLLVSQNYEQHKAAFFSLISDGSETSIDFIYSYLQQGTNLKEFFGIIGSKYRKFYEFLLTNPLFNNEDRERYFHLLLQNASPYYFDNFNSYGNISERLENMPEFLDLMLDNQRTRRIIEQLDLKFTRLTQPSDPESKLQDFIYENDHYQINPYMLEYLMKAYGNFSRQEFDTRNFSAIVHSECDPLINYISQNAEEYVKNVYLLLESNIQDKEPELSSLLNLDISIETKKEIVKKVNKKIITLKDIEDPVTQLMLITSNMIEPSWENILVFYNQTKENIPDSLIQFLNNEDNYKMLTKDTFQENELPELAESYQDFHSVLPITEEISTQALEFLIVPFNDKYEAANLEDIRRNKLAILVEKDKLIVSEEIFSILKTNFPGLEMTYLEKNLNHFVETNHSFEEKETVFILNSSELSKDEKSNLLNHTLESVILESSAIIEAVGQLLEKHALFETSLAILRKAILSIRHIEPRIIAFTKHIHLISREIRTEILQSLPIPYSEIAIGGKRPLIPLSETNAQFALKLEEAGYISKSEYEKKGIRISTFRNV